MKYTSIIIHRIIKFIVDSLYNDKKSFDDKIHIFIIPCILGLSPERQNDELAAIKKYFDTNRIKNELNILEIK